MEVSLTVIVAIRIDIELYRKSLMKALFLHLQVTWMESYVQLSKFNSLKSFSYHSSTIVLQIIIGLIAFIGSCVTR